MHHQRNDAPSSHASRTGRDHAYTVKYTLHALEQLALKPHSVPELAKALGISDRTARRLLQRLAAEGYAQQGSGLHRRYRATLRLAGIGNLLLDHAALPQAALPHLERLAVWAWGRAELWVPIPEGAVCLLDVDRALAWPEPHAIIGRRTSRGDHPAARLLQGEPGDDQAESLVAPVRDHGEVIAAVALEPEQPACAPVDVLDCRVKLTASEISAVLEPDVSTVVTS
jgi:IclR helix-turn-helix domain